jgi:hypothetical protein
MAVRDDVKTSLLFVLGSFGVAIVVVIVLAMIVLYYQTENRLAYERWTSAPFVDRENALADQQAKLVDYERVGVVEQGGQTVTVYRIPIERAMDLVLDEWKSGVTPGPAVPGEAAEAPSPPDGGNAGPSGGEDPADDGRSQAEREE